MAQSKIINNTKSGNYVSDNSVFILDKFSPDTSNELIGNLADMVMSIEPFPVYQIGGKLESPYKPLDTDRPVIDVYINSNGGSGYILDSIVMLLGIAKSRGAIIRTTVLSRAASCGSLLAITGTPGFRIMYSQAYHFIHFGNHALNAAKEDEIQMAAKHIKEAANNKQNMYLQHTNLTAKELKKLQSNEQGNMNAQTCLDKGLCDWIITDFGDIIGRSR